MDRRQLNTQGLAALELVFSLLIIGLLFLSFVFAIQAPLILAKSRNARRWQDVSKLSTAMYEYVLITESSPPGVSSDPQQLGTAQQGCDLNCPEARSQCLDLTTELGPYLSSIPIDIHGSEQRSGYMLWQDEAGIITVSACQAEQGAVIKLSR